MVKMILLQGLFILFFVSCLGQQPVLHEDLALKYLIQLPADNKGHHPVVILLHGYGSDEKDLFELRNSFPNNYIVLAVRAPYSLPGKGYLWYEFSNINGVHDGNKDQLENSRNLVVKFVNQVVAKYKANSEEVYLVGFSQGAIMCYQVGLTNPGNVKGMAALSGMIFPSLKPLVKNTESLKRLKIFAAHGTADNRIPFSNGKAACDYLKSIGLKPDFHEYAGMGHSISSDVLRDLLTWMK